MHNILPYIAEHLSNSSAILAINKGDNITQFRDIIYNFTTWRPDYLKHQAENFKSFYDLQQITTTAIEFDYAILQLSKSKLLNQNNIILLNNLLKTNSLITIYGHKNIGANSILKWAKQYFNIIEKFNKHHQIIFSLQQNSNINLSSNQEICIENKYLSKAGNFSYGKIDEGSKLLTKYFSTIIDSSSQIIADFGAGWGYLSYQLTEYIKQKNINLDNYQIDLYEADYTALQCCKKNLSHFSNIFNFYWHDITAENISQKYDAIICNPPFHSDKKTDLDLGKNFIKKANLALKNKGQLLLVANRHLPYEEIIKEHFTLFKILEQNNKFKIILASNIPC